MRIAAVRIYIWALAMYTAQEVNLQEVIAAMVPLSLHFTAKMQQKVKVPWRIMCKDYTLEFCNSRYIPKMEECIREINGR